MKSYKQGYILSFDQGTTSSRAIIFNHDGCIVSSAQMDIKQYYPKPGWVEHDPLEIWETQITVAREAIRLANIKIEEIISIGITNQRETIVVWDKNTGNPVYNAIVWQCRRSTAICQELINSGLEQEFIQRTGLRLDPYFSGTKLTWLFREKSELRSRAERGEILFGTIDCWLLWKLTGKHETDITNASRTLLYNIYDEKWDLKLLSLLDIPVQILPTVLSSADDFGKTNLDIFGKAIPINGVLGDQQAALYGHTCFNAGMAKNTYGTGCFILLNTGETPVLSKNNLLTTIAWRIGKRKIYALEGAVFIGGAVIQWLRDELKLISTAEESETIAISVENTNGVYIVPAFVGLGAPYWDPEARGSIFGITRGVNRAHIVRAALESICFQTEDLLSAMVADYGKSINILKADGGASVNKFLMQFQANISGVPVCIPKIKEITALGVAYMAGIFCGYWENEKEIENKGQIQDIYNPVIDEKKRTHTLNLWHIAISATREYKDEEKI